MLTHLQRLEADTFQTLREAGSESERPGMLCPVGVEPLVHWNPDAASTGSPDREVEA